MPAPKPVDLKTFIEDPAFQGDRDLMRGYMRHVLEEEARGVADRAQKKEKPAGIFDALFGYHGPDADDSSENVFDGLVSGLFGRRR